MPKTDRPSAPPSELPSDFMKEVTAGPGHAIEMREGAPYVHVRAGLWALVDRKSFYRLIEMGCHAEKDGASWFGLWSQGCFFPVIPSKDLS